MDTPVHQAHKVSACPCSLCFSRVWEVVGMWTLRDLKRAPGPKTSFRQAPRSQIHTTQWTAAKLGSRQVEARVVSASYANSNSLSIYTSGLPGPNSLCSAFNCPDILTMTAR